MSQEIRALIFRMVAENPTWGAPRIHGELLKLGFHLSEITVSRWLRRLGTWGVGQPALPFAVRGRTVSRSAGLGVADVTCWIT
jgi:hypothetical protein